VRGEAERADHRAYFVVIVPFVHAEALRLFLGGHGTLDRNTVPRFAHHSHVVPIGPVNGQPYGNARFLVQQRAFDPFLGAVGGIGSAFFPPTAALWSSLRPGSASSS
jgi:hypothetical protein